MTECVRVQQCRIGQEVAAYLVWWLQGHKSQVLCLAFSPDSTKMATASKDGTWRVWNIDVRFHQQEDPKCLLQQPQEVRVQIAATVLMAAVQHEESYVDDLNRLHL